ncbi:MAG TPA: type IV secretion system DNA-binding domain-containing protein [Candidatus Paceibacterota bacterium]
MSNEDRIIYFAETDYRNKRERFGIKERDRDRHMYVIGKTGMGKSTLLENLAIQDIQNGSGLGFIDPHGGSAELLLEHIPASRINDVIYFAPFDTDHPISFNVMEDVGKDQRHLVADGLMAAFKKIWPDVWSARMEYILNNILLALIEYPDSTLLGVNRMLADKGYRDTVVAHITDPAVRAFWLDEFAKYTDRYMQEAGAAIQNKIGQFVSSPIIRNIIGQPRSSFDIREAMDNKKILIMNLSKGRMGENNASLLGGMLITKIYLAAMSRANLTRDQIAKLPHFFFYVDEFQSFVNESFANILAEARKYKLDLTIAHQYVEQMPEEVRDAVFGNVGTTIAFRVGPLDAELLEKVFAPKFMVEDLVNLGRNQIYLSLMIDGIGSPPFSATTLAPIARSASSNKEAILDASRRTYSKGREGVEAVIRIWHETALNSPPGSPPPPRPAQGFAPTAQSFPPRPVGGLSSTSGAAKRRKKQGAVGGMGPRPPIPQEAMQDLGSSNLKSLLEDAMKSGALNLDQEEDEELVYKSELPEPTEQGPEPRKEISPGELKKIISGE